MLEVRENEIAALRKWSGGVAQLRGNMAATVCIHMYMDVLAWTDIN